MELPKIDLKYLREAFKEREAGHKAVETKFQNRVAKTLGLTREQLRAKVRQMQRRR